MSAVCEPRRRACYFGCYHVQLTACSQTRSSMGMVLENYKINKYSGQHNKIYKKDKLLSLPLALSTHPSHLLVTTDPPVRYLPRKR